MSKIEVTGVGRLKLTPNKIVVSVGISSRRVDFEELMKRADQKISQLHQAILGVGFESSEIKTSSLTTDVYYRQSQRGYGQVMGGYEFQQQVMVEFDLDMRRLANLISALSKSDTHPKIQIKFVVKDQQKYSDQLLELATRDARQKALVLAKSAGVRLGAISNISHSWGEIRFSSETDYSYSLQEDVDGFMSMDSLEDITPGDIDIKDEATFVWELVDN